MFGDRNGNLYPSVVLFWIKGQLAGLICSRCLTVFCSNHLKIEQSTVVQVKVLTGSDKRVNLCKTHEGKIFIM